MSAVVTPHILVVDDVEKNARLLADVLAAKGYRTSKALSGEAALAAIREAPPGICSGATMKTLSLRTSTQAFCGSSGECETNGMR